MRVSNHQARLRLTSWLLSSFLMTPLFVGCGGRTAESVDNSRPVSNAAPIAPETKKTGLTNTQKVGVTLAGAAALYYLYNQHKKAQAADGANSQYYLSKNGRVYYRDAQHKAHWVTPPQGGVQVPADEAERYRDFQGYQNRSTGRDLTTLPEAQSASF